MILDTAIAALRLSMAVLNTLSMAGNQALERLMSLQSKSKLVTKARLKKSCTKTGSQEEISSEESGNQQLIKIVRTFTNQAAVIYDLTPSGGPYIIMSGKHAFVLSYLLGQQTKHNKLPLIVKRYERVDLAGNWVHEDSANFKDALKKAEYSETKPKKLLSILKFWDNYDKNPWYPVERPHVDRVMSTVLNKLYKKYLDSIATGDTA